MTKTGKHKKAKHTKRPNASKRTLRNRERRRLVGNEEERLWHLNSQTEMNFNMRQNINIDDMLIGGLYYVEYYAITPGSDDFYYNFNPMHDINVMEGIFIGMKGNEAEFRYVPFNYYYKTGYGPDSYNFQNEMTHLIPRRNILAIHPPKTLTMIKMRDEPTFYSPKELLTYASIGYDDKYGKNITNDVANALVGEDLDEY